MSTTQPAARSSRPTMSIGQVLAALKQDFPDVSVSKIRFLESEGLIDPERTPSGYRKFAETDVARLRTILTLQRDSYLPLKVIREHLAALDAGETPPPPPPAAAPVQNAHDAAPAPPATPPAPAPSVNGSSADDDIDAPVASLRLTESDLAEQTGLEPSQVRALRDYGVICTHTENGHPYFDGDDLAVARLARGLLDHGLDARHLKTLRRSAEQEASLYEQLVAPGLRSRKAEAREQAAGTLRELASLSRRLRHAYLRQNLRHLVRDR